MDNTKRSQHQQRIDEFMRLAGQTVPETPLDNPTDEVRILRAKLIFEECLETINQGLGVNISLSDSLGKITLFTGNNVAMSFGISHAFDMVETIDGCQDIRVVTTGTLSALGIPDLPFEEEIDKNNLAKFGPGGYRAEDTQEKPGPAGKWMKPPGHKPPDIVGILHQITNFSLTEFENKQWEKAVKPTPEQMANTKWRTHEPRKLIEVGGSFQSEYDPVSPPDPIVKDSEGRVYLILRLTPYVDDEYTNFCRLIAKKFAHDAYYKDEPIKRIGSEVSTAIMIIEDELRSKAGPTPKKEKQDGE